MEQVITIHQSLIKEKELVLVPRSQYEELVRISEEQKELNVGITESLKEEKRGKISGPFKSAKDLIASLLS